MRTFIFLLYYDYPEEDLPSYLHIFTITVFAVEKLDHGILFKNMSIQYSWRRKQWVS